MLKLTFQSFQHTRINHGRVYGKMFCMILYKRKKCENLTIFQLFGFAHGKKEMHLSMLSTGELLPATEVELNLGDKMIKVIAVDTNLNCGAAYSLPTPAKWRKQIGNYVNLNLNRFKLQL